MGSGTFDPGAYATYTASTAGKSRGAVFSSRSMHEKLDPKDVKIRESRDSKDNPRSTPVIVALDVTGSMGQHAEYIARKGLGTLFNEILASKPITDPHIMFMALGDAACDSCPLQVSQFEADNRIVEQLTQIFLEGGGGGNATESYDFPWYFAANHTEHDSLIKRGKRGYLFTIGDEESPAGLTKEQIKKFIGDDVQGNLSPEELLAEAQRKYDVFHIIIAQGSHARANPDGVRESWNKLLGQHAIWLEDCEKLSETIVAAIEVVEGRGVENAKKFGDSVYKAVKGLPRSRVPRLAIKNAKS